MNNTAQIKQYLQRAKNNQMENFSNADGFIDNDLSFTGEDFFNAGGSQTGSAPTSQPYIVNITSASGGTVPNFEILGSFQYVNNAGFTANGDLVIGSVTISSGIPSVSYREMLWQFQSNPFSVGMTYISSATANQINQPFSVNTKDANGSVAQKVMIPVLSPYQQQNNSVILNQAYRIDGFTKLIITAIQPNATVTYIFYPADNINLARALAGQSVSKQFGTPSVANGQTIRIAQ